MLGFFSRFLDIDEVLFKKFIERNVKKEFIEINLKVFEFGRRIEMCEVEKWRWDIGMNIWSVWIEIFCRRFNWKDLLKLWKEYIWVCCIIGEKCKSLVLFLKI